MANRKVFVKLLGLALLLQLSSAKPVPEDEDSKSIEISDVKGELERFAVVKFEKVAANIVPKLIEVLEKVIVDLGTDDDFTDADNEFIEDLEEFLAESFDEEDEPIPKFAIEWLLQTAATVDSYLVEGEDGIKNEKVRDLLETHGWQKVRDEFDALIVPVIDELGRRIKNYYENLDSTEQESEKAIGNWVEKFDDQENDAGDKINLLLEFIIGSDDSVEESE